MFSFLKRKAEGGEGLSSYEEQNEKKTTAGGYLMLLIMAILIITAGEKIFSDLKQLPAQPTPPSYCTANIVSGYAETRYLPNCSFTPTDIAFGIATQVGEIQGALSEIASYNLKIGDLVYQNQNLESQVVQLEQQYNLSLQEKMANEQVLFDSRSLQQQIAGIRSAIAQNQTVLASLESQKAVVVEQVKPYIAPLESSYKRALDSYATQNAWFRLKVFGLMLLFVLPLFAASLRGYLSLKKRNSPYTVIATAVMGASAFLFLQVVLVFLYDILPKEWLARIFNIFLAIPLFRYVLYYGTILVVIGVFGGIVYLIQKRVFDPKRITVRRLKDSKCPGCSFSINQFQDFCPKCGIQLKEVCAACGNKRMTGLPFCPVCGKTGIPEAKAPAQAI